jgi:hypothetical protein
VKEEKKMGMMERMMGFMMGRMSKEEKEEMMGKMMERFFANMTAEDKEKMMEAMMPKMMMGMMGEGEGECGPMEMMSKMMEGGQEGEMPMMPQMMMEMMPHCIKMMLPDVPIEKRIDFVLTMVTTLMEQGCIGMSNEEKTDFVAKVIEKVKNV